MKEIKEIIGELMESLEKILSTSDVHEKEAMLDLIEFDLNYLRDILKIKKTKK